MAIVDDLVSGTMPEALGHELARAALALARRFTAGATMWCIAPQWPEHARHVAVEFVHPVIVGKRALAAVAVAVADPASELRAVVRPGDIVVAVGPAADGVAADVLRRAPAWDATTFWFGAGAAPTAPAADHVLWLDDAGAAHDGGIVLLYHVAWELTHVCFEHPGLLRDDADCDGEETCTTCADEGRLAEVIEVVDGGDAIVRTARGVERADVTLVAPLERHDLVLVHAGTAIARVDGR